jgi:hypothetical protein
VTARRWAVEPTSNRRLTGHRFAIYGEAAARQLDVSVEVLRARVRAVFQRVLESLVT